MAYSGAPVGSLSSQFRQVVNRMIDARMNAQSTVLLYGTVIRDGVITLDRDGFEISQQEGEYILLHGVTLEPDDRIVAVPINGVRGTILVLGTWQDLRLVTRRREHPYYFAEVSTVGTVAPPDPNSESVPIGSIQLSRSWLHVAARLRLIGKATDSLSGGSIPPSTMTVNVVDSGNGVIATQNVTHDEEFSIEIPWGQISVGDHNFLTFNMTYENSNEGTMTISECVLLIEDP